MIVINDGNLTIIKNINFYSLIFYVFKYNN